MEIKPTRYGWTNRRGQEEPLRYRQSVSVPVCAVREFRGRALTSRVCTPLVSLCVCLSVRGSVPLKQSSAQYDPCPAACECEAEEKRSSTRRDTDSDCRCAAEAAIRRNNPHNIEEKGHQRGSPTARRLKFHGRFERKRQRLTGITELQLRSAQPAGWEFLCRLGAPNLTDTKTITHTVDLEEPDTHFYLEIIYSWSVQWKHSDERWVLCEPGAFKSPGGCVLVVNRQVSGLQKEVSFYTIILIV